MRIIASIQGSISGVSLFRGDSPFSARISSSLTTSDAKDEERAIKSDLGAATISPTQQSQSATPGSGTDRARGLAISVVSNLLSVASQLDEDTKALRKGDLTDDKRSELTQRIDSLSQKYNILVRSPSFEKAKEFITSRLQNASNHTTPKDNFNVDPELDALATKGDVSSLSKLSGLFSRLNNARTVVTADGIKTATLSANKDGSLNENDLGNTIDGVQSLLNDLKEGFSILSKAEVNPEKNTADAKKSINNFIKGYNKNGVALNDLIESSSAFAPPAILSVRA